MSGIAAITVSAVSAYMLPAGRTLLASAAVASKMPTAVRGSTPQAVHFGTEIWTATDHGSGEAANYDYVIGDGSDVRLLGIYGNAALDNTKPDANDREFLFSISSANNAGSARLAGAAYAPSHHSADPAIFAGVLKQTGGNSTAIPVNVTFPGGGILLSRGATKIAVVTGVYNPADGFRPIIYPTSNAVMSAELQLTFVYAR